jgi:uncharacterized iron-regulated protein
MACWLPALALAALLAALVAGCAAQEADLPGRATGPAYAFPVPPDTTFDLTRGEPLQRAQLEARLRGARLVFLGEHHTDARSHAFQREVLELLLAQGRPLAVALEMFPPQADPVLEDWRQGRLDELAFLERSGWYEHWGYPWSYYRELFALFRERRVPLHGVNAERETRQAVRENKLDTLPEGLREEIGALEPPLAPHAAYLLDTLRAAGHQGKLRPDAPSFQGYYRVQRLWDRLMGRRSARLAEALGADGVAVLLVGAGHLAFGLGANLQAAQVSDLPRLSVWEAVVDESELDRQGRYPVPVGMADLVRVYRRDDAAARFYGMAGLKLASGEGGVKVEAMHLFGHSRLSALRAGDVIEALNGAPLASPEALRLAYETTGPQRPATVRVRRDGQVVELDVTPRPSPHP